ncbi:MAG: response regulator, partial [Burkholderiales bacterium]|nr:response regulator [Burkholderiales bacterium]
MLTHATPSRGLILIIDDSIPSIHALSGGLGDLAEILFATDGERGIRLARESHPDLILLDVEMPGVDGFGVCRRLKADPATCGCTVIFVTAHNDSEREISALAAGAVDFIAKPVNMAVARARVIAHLRLKQQTDALERMHDDLQAILDNMPAMIGYWSSDLRNRFGNQAYLDWFGRRPEDVCGAHLEELLGQGLYQESMPRIQEV